MKSFPSPCATAPLSDRLLSIQAELQQGGEDVLLKIHQYLSKLPQKDASFFSQTIKKKDAGAIYYPFAASLDHVLCGMEQAVLMLCSLLEKSEAAMVSEALLKGSRLLEDYWTYKREINACLGSCEALFRSHDEAISLKELDTTIQRLRYQTENFLERISLENPARSAQTN